MRRSTVRGCLTGMALVAVIGGGGGSIAVANESEKATSSGDDTLRIATYNISFHRTRPGELADDLRGGTSVPARQIAAVLQRVRPDVVLLNEFDFDASGEALRLFRTEYLAVPQGEWEPLDYPYDFTAEVNTGEPSGMDLNRDGRSDGPNDAFGFGRYPGQYGMAILSRPPILREQVRTFRKLLWRDQPEARLPIDPVTRDSYYTAEQLAVFRLSSKSHWDVPLQVGDRVLHLLASHPTPPAFDGPEDRHGCRNHDEIRLWADYLSPDRAGYIVDDAGRSGGLAAEATFVVVGDLNADPIDGGSVVGAIQQLLEHPRVQSQAAPESSGAVAAGGTGVNRRHRGEARFDTANFSRGSGPGNLRVDYVLPSRELQVVDCGVYWPAPGEPGTELLDASDHRLVWADVRW